VGKSEANRSKQMIALEEQVMEEALSPESWHAAWKAVVANGGAPGIDGMKCEELVPHLKQHGDKIRAKLMAGTYQPSPVKRVTIPKPGGGERLLGIPTVVDRFVHQLLLQALTPFWEKRFSARSFGFRPGRSQKDAIRCAQSFVLEGRGHVVDMDIEKFFDRVNHDILMRRVKEVVADKAALRLIGRILRSGILVEGIVVTQEEGTPQGSPLSPLLANIYLDPLDKELEKRGLAHVRYADDCNIYVRSAAAGDRVLVSISAWIERHLKLKVNQTKSGSGPVDGRKFLGIALTKEGVIEVARKSIERFKERVREIWNARSSRTNHQQREVWNRYVRGWSQYFKIALPREVERIEGWIRRHIRCYYWQRWHCSKGREGKLRALGCTATLARAGRSSRGAWRMASHPAMHKAISNAQLRRHRFLMPTDCWD
jgi:RNA-directed DNA polymerase